MNRRTFLSSTAIAGVAVIFPTFGAAVTLQKPADECRLAAMAAIQATKDLKLTLNETTTAFGDYSGRFKSLDDLVKILLLPKNLYERVDPMQRVNFILRIKSGLENECGPDVMKQIAGLRIERSHYFSRVKLIDLIRDGNYMQMMKAAELVS